eukprot:724358-Pleurochrysis_carterae.AAC.1
MSCPKDELLAAAQQILRYLSHHRSLELRFEKTSRPVTGVFDSNWAMRHSTSGYVFIYKQAAISWSSKKQPCVALSSCESIKKCRASEAAKEAVYLRTLFEESLGLPHHEPTSLPMDSKSAIDLAYNPEHHQRSKHTDHCHFFVRERVEEHDITI